MSRPGARRRIVLLVGGLLLAGCFGPDYASPSVEAIVTNDSSAWVLLVVDGHEPETYAVPPDGVGRITRELTLDWSGPPMKPGDARVRLTAYDQSCKLLASATTGPGLQHVRIGADGTLAITDPPPPDPTPVDQLQLWDLGRSCP